MAVEGGAIEVHIEDDLDTISRWVRDFIVQQIRQSQERFSLVLSGGSTPTRLFRALARANVSKRLDWGDISIFWADERCVPPSSPDSNFRMAARLLLDRVPIPKKQIYRMRGEEPDIQKAALDYEKEILHFFKGDENKATSFSLVLLGVGSDGHTASLFPGSEALSESTRLVRAVEVDAPQPRRITLTLPAINSAKCVLFLISGADKAQVVKRLVERSETSALPLPSEFVMSERGRTILALDRAAASGLH